MFDLLESHAEEQVEVDEPTRPAAHLAWLVEPAAAGLLAAQPALDEVIVFPRDRLTAAGRAGRWDRAALEAAHFVRALRARRFDRVISPMPGRKTNTSPSTVKLASDSSHCP